MMTPPPRLQVPRALVLLLAFSITGSTSRGVTEDSNWSYQAGEFTFLDAFLFNYGQRYDPLPPPPATPRNLKIDFLVCQFQSQFPTGT